jgi:hypothetical protein
MPSAIRNIPLKDIVKSRDKCRAQDQPDSIGES